MLRQLSQHLRIPEALSLSGSRSQQPEPSPSPLPPEPGPLDIVWDEAGSSSLTAEFGESSGIAILGIAFRFSGPLISLEATYGGTPLELVGFTFDSENEIASAMFIGNGLTTGVAELVVTPVGATIGPAVGRINDNYGYETIASGWNNGTFGVANTTTGTLTVSGVSGEGRLAYSSASTNSNARPSPLPTTQNEDLFWFIAMSGVKVPVPEFTLVEGDWTKDGNKWNHTGNPSTLATEQTDEPYGPYVGFEIKDVVIAEGGRMHIRFLTADNSVYTQAIYIGPYSGTIRKVVGSEGFSGRSFSIYGVGDLSFGEFQYVDNPEYVVGDFGRSIGTVQNNDTLRIQYGVPTSYTMTAIEVHNEG